MRYDACNITNRETVELRIFRSTLNHTEFLRDLEFSHALAAFTEPAVASIKDMLDYRMFAKFVTAYGEMYPALAQFLKKKGVI